MKKKETVEKHGPCGSLFILCSLRRLLLEIRALIISTLQHGMNVYRVHRFVFEKKVREDKENIYGSLSQINVAEDGMPAV